MSFTFNIFISISYEKVLEAVTFIKNYLTDRNIIFQPTTGIICGTGLSIMIYIRTFSASNCHYISQASLLNLSPPHWITRRSPTIPSLPSLAIRDNSCWEGWPGLSVSYSRVELTFIKDSLRLTQLFLSGWWNFSGWNRLWRPTWLEHSTRTTRWLCPLI